MSNQVKLAKSAAVPENSSYQYRATLTDADEVVIGAAAISQILLTLTNVADEATVNSRAAVNVYSGGTGECTVTAGALVMQFDPEDMPSIGTEQYQQRRLTLDVRLVGGGRFTHEVLFYVQNLTDIS